MQNGILLFPAKGTLEDVGLCYFVSDYLFVIIWVSPRLEVRLCITKSTTEVLCYKLSYEARTV